jgi:peptidyl-prolyl cis-trans isomerase SurA
MKQFILIFIFIGFTMIGSFLEIQAQTDSEDIQTEYVLTVGGEGVTLNDFKHIYGKNNRDSIITPELLDEYMDLFIKFKLKVMEAEYLGMDTVADYIKELAGYRKQLARPYLVDIDLLDELVQEAFDRQQEEIHARHILVSVNPDALPADTIRAWRRISLLKARVESGEDFTEVAKSKGGSDDPSAADNGGDLGWFTAFSMIYNFEVAAYSTPVGEISNIVRTRFGYHFLKVDGRRDARGEVQVAHIMVRVPDVTQKAMLESTKATIDAVSAFLKAGETFESLALKYSDDATTASKGGVLPWFGTGKMVEEFENNSFALENDGDISEPFLSSYGWHIVKRLGFKGLVSFDEVKNSLKKKVSRDSRADKTRSSFLNKLKSEYGFTQDARRVSNLVISVNQTDSVFHKGHPIENVKKSELGRSLFSIDGNKTTVQDFINYANTQKHRGLNRPSEMILKSLIHQMVEENLLAYEDERLEDKHSDFRLLIEEYHDGILLFELTDNKVWSRAVRDTSGLEEFHANNSELFMWPERLDIAVYTCEDAKLAKKVKKGVKKGADIESMRRELIGERPLAIRTESALYPEGTNTWADTVFYAISKGTFNLKSKAPRFMTFEVGVEGIVLVDVRELVPPTPKSLEEARGQVIASYQDHLEKEWIMALRRKYPIEINTSVLYSLID